MRQRKIKPKTAKVIWRISDAAPLGEYVREDEARQSAADEAAAAAVVAGPKPERGWHHSSHDLVQGVEVHEEPLDTLSDEILDELFKRK